MKEKKASFLRIVFYRYSPLCLLFSAWELCP